MKTLSDLIGIIGNVLRTCYHQAIIRSEKSKMLSNRTLDRGEISSNVTNLKFHTTSIITRKEYPHLGSQAVRVTVLKMSSVIMWIYSSTSSIEVVMIVSDIIIPLLVVISKLNFTMKLLSMLFCLSKKLSILLAFIVAVTLSFYHDV